jgi:hypothetical protein
LRNVHGSAGFINNQEIISFVREVAPVDPANFSRRQEVTTPSDQGGHGTPVHDHNFCGGFGFPGLEGQGKKGVPLDYPVRKALQNPRGGETGFLQKGEEVPFGEGASDAFPPQGVIVPDGWVGFRGGNHIGHYQPSARFEDPQGFLKGAPFVAREVDDAVGQDGVNAGVREGQLLQVAQFECQIVISQGGGHPHRTPGSPAQHGGEHVHPDDPAFRTH